MVYVLLFDDGVSSVVVCRDFTLACFPCSVSILIFSLVFPLYFLCSLRFLLFLSWLCCGVM
jgi:hypothetical protein